MYVWTKKGEEKGKQLIKEKGNRPGFNRPEGTIAYFGYEPLKGGLIAQDWEQKGYVVKVEDK